MGPSFLHEKALAHEGFLVLYQGIASAMPKLLREVPAFRRCAGGYAVFVTRVVIAR